MSTSSRAFWSMMVAAAGAVVCVGCSGSGSGGGGNGSATVPTSTVESAPSSQMGIMQSIQPSQQAAATITNEKIEIGKQLLKDLATGHRTPQSLTADERQILGAFLWIVDEQKKKRHPTD